MLPTPCYLSAQDDRDQAVVSPRALAPARIAARSEFSEHVNSWMSAIAESDALRAIREKEGRLRLLVCGRVLAEPGIVEHPSVRRAGSHP